MRPEPVNCGAGEHRESSNTVLSLVLLVVLTASAGAQSPDDSLAIRLRRAENAIAALQQQVAEQADAGARSRSGMRLELYGRVMITGFGNSRRVNNVDNPQLVRPDTAAGVPVRGVGMAARQTTLGLAVSRSEVLGGRFEGDIDVDFYGGQQPSPGGRTFPLIRLRTARAQIHWDELHLLVGQESPLIAGLNPVSPAAIGSPGFAAAGNLWLWLPQARLGWQTTGSMRLGVQGAVLAPTSGDPAGAFDTDNDLAERSQRPFIQARASAAWGEFELRGEIGCGVHQGWLVPVTTTLASFAVACDALVPLTTTIELRGEFFSGQALRGLGGGGIGQNFTAGNNPLETTGGWAQLNVRPLHPLRLGAGCGMDHPASAPARRRNDACATYVMIRPAGPLFVGGEYRIIRTEYAVGRYTNDHVTISAGFEF